MIALQALINFAVVTDQPTKGLAYRLSVMEVQAL